MKIAMLLSLLFAAIALRASAATEATVSVLYAGSLVTPMQGPIKSALAAQSIDFQGEPGGSKELAHLISAGLRTPDIFISVDPRLVLGLGTKIESAFNFASTSLGIGWSASSKYAPLFARVAAGKEPMLTALETPGLRIARTDPRVDPKGAYTVDAMNFLARPSGEQRILGSDENPAQTFPEENLLVRLETGAADVGFIYRTEAIARRLQFLPLPGAASMSDTITYTIARLRNAPHPAQADEFMGFLMAKRGKSILEKAGIEYFARPRRLVLRK